jgi:acetolactate synthase-1/2/3 large subunit
MNGAESLVRTAVRAGYDICFANPGTTEMPLVAALDTAPEIRPVLGLFEGACTGAADGYARVSGRPALVLLHLAPGLANGLANLHNARRAGTSMVVVVGEHTTWHRPHDPPLAGDIEALARAISPTAWVKTASDAKTVARDFASADRAAREQPGRLSFLIVPADAQWDPADEAAAPFDATAATLVSEVVTARVARALREAGEAGALWLAGNALGERGVVAAGRVSAATGCRLITGSFPAFSARGGGLPSVERLPYFPEPATRCVEALERVVLVEAEEPVTFFGYPKVPSQVLVDATQREVLAGIDENGPDALEALAQALDAPLSAPVSSRPVDAPEGPLDPATFSKTIALVQPENAVVIDEALTSSTGYWEAAAGAPRYDHICLTGGAIGMGIPAALGAALAAPERPVLSLQADGSGLYTLQGLWSQSRENLNVTTVVCSNRSYRILEVELARAEQSAGASARAFTELQRPSIDWLALAQGFGVPGEKVDHALALRDAIERALAETGPHLIEAEIV